MEACNHGGSEVAATLYRDVNFYMTFLCHAENVNETKMKYPYILLTEFEVRFVIYGLSFFPFIYGPRAGRAGHKSTGNNEDP